MNMSRQLCFRAGSSNKPRRRSHGATIDQQLELARDAAALLRSPSAVRLYGYAVGLSHWLSPA